MENIKFDFTDKNILVTGASSGIGKKVVVDLAEAGARVFAIARREQELNELHNTYVNIIPIACDVTDYTKINESIKIVVKEYGKIDGFVGCAGISELIPLRVMDLERAKNIMEVNFWGNINLLALITKRNISNDKASIVLVSSIAAHKGVKGKFAYASSKAALIASVKCFAHEIAPRLRINTISPGIIKETGCNNNLLSSIPDEVAEDLKNLYPFGLGEANDISAIIMFLLSDVSKWITGADFIVDGGHLA